MAGYNEVARIFDLRIFMWLNGVNSACFQPHISQKVVKCMP